MSASGAELASVATALEEMTRRVSSIAGSYEAAERDELAVELFGVERALNAALRRLVRVVDADT